ncbi:DUF4275 family protein [Cytobacillus sp. FJAT-54145]|uniref:DUF4275 family protein n=1 Tax=Cytobacillus spartinae TaxID=3299023 RepID=A0ABW6K7E5_9BACI
MDIVDLLKQKKIRVIEIGNWGGYLRNEWEKQFANHLSQSDKKSIYLFDQDGACGYLWHLFSYGKRNCLTEELANEAFNQAHKKSCFLFYQHSDTAFIIENASGFTADDLHDESDVYIVDKHFNWTYVKTHETGWCGPYFSRK